MQSALVKAGTPQDIVARLNIGMGRALTSPSVRDAFARIAAEPGGGSAGEFGTFIKSQMAYWADVISRSGIKMPNQQ